MIVLRLQALSVDNNSRKKNFNTTIKTKKQLVSRSSQNIIVSRLKKRNAQTCTRCKDIQ